MIEIPFTNKLMFSTYTGTDMDGNDITGFSFYDKSENYLFQFLSEDDKIIEAMEYYITQLLYETKTGNSFKSATKDDLQKLHRYFCHNNYISYKEEKDILKLPIMKTKIRKEKIKNPDLDIKDLEQKMEKLNIKEDPVHNEEEKHIPPKSKSRFLLDSYIILWSSKVILYIPLAISLSI